MKQNYKNSGAVADEVIMDDAQLMADIAAGSRAAFGEFLERHVQDVFLFAFSILKDAAMAEDLTQETFTRLWRNAGQWAPTGRPKSWLLRIAHNLCIDALRRRKPEVELERADTLLPPVEASQEQALYRSEVALNIKAAMFQLPERQRAALMLVYYADCSNAEAAEIMTINIDALESLLSRGRKRMKDLLQKSRENF